MNSKLHKKLSERQEKGTLRSLSSFEGYTDFFSNDYLGMARKTVALKGISGSTGSRLLSGDSTTHQFVETEFAKFFKVPSVLHFNSGYDANLGVFSTLPQKGDTILYDELIHASVRDGVRLSWAKSFSFRHNDLGHLEQRLNKAEGAIYVAVESLYSMDGDIAPLIEIVALCNRYDAYLIVDEAHSGGVFGESGRGFIDALGIVDSVFLRLITFGKAYGSHGAIVLCETSTKEYLINFCRPFIYSTALPASALEHNLRQVEAEDLHSKQQLLEEIIAYYCSKMNDRTSISDQKSPIQIVELGDVQKTRIVASALQDNKIGVKPIFSPTVPEGKERLRICLHAFNTFEEIDQLTTIIKSYQ